MQKEIPKREGQKFNGTGVSVAALVFLLIGVPVASAYLIDFALYFGGEEIEYSSTDGPVSSSFIPINTGSSDVALCSDKPIFNSTCYGGQVGGIRYFKGEKYHVISGCENRSNIPNPYFNYSGTSGFCGSDGYDYAITGKNLFNQNRTFPAINIEFVGGTSYICDPNYFGNSLVDFKITFVRFSPTQFIPLPNGQLGPASYIENGSFSVNDVAKFDNGGTYDYEPTDMCNPTVSFTYALSLSELNELEDFRKAYFETNTTFESIYIILEMDNFRTETGAPYDYSNYYLPFQGATDDKNYAKFSVPTYEVDAVNFTLKVGVFAIGIGFWILAIASTPFWNPIKERFA
jgi:hypothetical protein